ncbi:preprotein translocase subunit SecD [Thermococcus piezophilus]|uniref:Protein-export membrane protein SecD n=1 Tax=Thermococcus piezophilus TaxID=1712654 RepID=A0A172WFV1_9EURY|nr:preprotein translocase subunit SecD [Thermococcus piezophilus]ANF22324.1 preprotein translocase subunit SecD [Thermococcus piezophilus]
MKRRTKKLLLNWRIILLTVFLIGSVVTLAVRPLTFGIDISGGVALVAQTEHPVDADTMQLVVDSLQKRLNTLGLRDITVEAQGDQIVLVKVANVTTAEEADAIKNVIESQGVFYMEFDGVIFGTGQDVEYVGIYQIKPDNTWSVPFRISKSAAEKFAELAKGKTGWPVDMFLDPPVNSLLVVPDSVYNLMNSSEFNAQVPEAPTLLQRITKAFNITVVAYANQTADELADMAEGREKIVLVDLNQGLQSELENMNVTVRLVQRGPGESDHALIIRTLGLYGPYSVGEGLATGQPQQDVQITGTASDRLTAEQEARQIYTVLKSGSLPVKLNVVGMEFISPRLGENFKYQALLAGIGALIAVFAIVYFHYRNWKIAIPVASTSFFEAIIILGFAALIQWNLDLPSIAGIIAAIGTGVDQQIVITDELLGGTKETRITRRSNVLKRMGRAFFVIFASAATTIVAMSFLLIYFVGTLKGFAFTTILGVVIGILVTRPAYAEIAKYLLGED